MAPKISNVSHWIWRMVELNELNWRTCGELVDEGEGLVVRVGHCDDCTGDRIKMKEDQKNKRRG